MGKGDRRSGKRGKKDRPRSAISPPYREPNGRAQRETTRSGRVVALNQAVPGYEARQRVHGLSKEDSMRPEAADRIGRAALAGYLASSNNPEEAQRESDRLLEAARLYQSAKANYERSLQVRRIRSSSSIDPAPKGFDGADPFDDPAYEEWCKRVRENYEGARRALNRTDDYMSMMVVDAVVLEDAPMMEWLKPLRIGLEALAEYFRLPVAADAAMSVAA